MGQESMAASQIDHPTAPEFSSHPPGHLPGLEELLAGQRSHPADGSTNFLEQIVAVKPE